MEPRPCPDGTLVVLRNAAGSFSCLFDGLGGVRGLVNAVLAMVNDDSS